MDLGGESSVETVPSAWLLTRLPDQFEPIVAAGTTAALLQRQQVFGILERHLKQLTVPHIPIDIDHRYSKQVPKDPTIRLDQIRTNLETRREALESDAHSKYRVRAKRGADGNFTFLSIPRQIDLSTELDELSELQEFPALWKLKLVSFDPLDWVVLGIDPATNAAESVSCEFDAWCQQWSQSNRIGGPGYLRGTWTPWGVSRRIIHLTRYLAWRTADDHPKRLSPKVHDELIGSICKDAAFLNDHVEWDVGGNHLIENGAALVMAGLLIAEDPRSWLQNGLGVLDQACREQFLSDGCHFERSPMYHLLCLERLLTVNDLLDRYGLDVPESIANVTQQSTNFAAWLRTPDGHIPLRNDSVRGQGRTIDECLRYAKRIGITPMISNVSVRGEERSSGYLWIRSSAGRMLIDAGPVGPSHLPGHSHSDTLGFSLWVEEQPLVTDTGVYNYVADQRRRHARSVRGHNTVQVGQTEPIALGGKYLLGPRPRPYSQLEEGSVCSFEGHYVGRPVGRDPYKHSRRIYAGPDWWLVRDTVVQHQGDQLTSRLQLSPGTRVKTSTGPWRLVVGPDDHPQHVWLTSNAPRRLTTGPYYPRFGVEHERSVLEMQLQPDPGKPATITFALDAGPEPRSITPRTNDGTVIAVEVEGKTVEIPASETTGFQRSGDQGKT